MQTWHFGLIERLSTSANWSVNIWADTHWVYWWMLKVASCFIQCPPTRPSLLSLFPQAWLFNVFNCQSKNVNCISLCIIYVVSAEGFFNTQLIWMASPGPAADCVGWSELICQLRWRYDRQVGFFTPLSIFKILSVVCVNTQCWLKKIPCSPVHIMFFALTHIHINLLYCNFQLLNYYK